MSTSASLSSFEEAADFHGHVCPGLAIGYRVAETALRLLEVERPHDEELVAIVENDTCAVDAIQVVTGCTFGKGNLVFNDYGKGVFSFFSRDKKKGIRIRYREFPSLPESEQARLKVLQEKIRSGDSVTENERREYSGLRRTLIRSILDCAAEDILDWRSLQGYPPPAARIRPSIVCEGCGEQVMETRIVDVSGRKLCIPCSNETN
jgi:formylmethanofuran dehydrogenase subunit E